MTRSLTVGLGLAAIAALAMSPPSYGEYDFMNVRYSPVEPEPYYWPSSRTVRVRKPKPKNAKQLKAKRIRKMAHKARTRKS